MGSALNIPPLAASILQELASEPSEAGMSLPRLGKRLGLGVSVLLRELTLMGSARIGNTTGPGWVQVEQQDGRWVAHLTAAGRLLGEHSGP